MSSFGTFVYAVTNGENGLQLRSQPDYDPKFRAGEFFASGRVIYSGMRARGDHGDWFPRIGEDGWLFETRDGARTLQRLDVKQGFFAYRVKNDPNGLAARKHPDYSPEQIRTPEALYTHGSIVVGTHRVRGEHGDWFVLLEGGGWLFETREGLQTLLPVEVERGMFCYRVENGRCGLQLRSRPDYDPRFRSGEFFASGRIIYSDLRVRGEHCDWFPRMGDDGWLFETRDGSRTLQRLDVEQGMFAYRVNNDPIGLAARRHPDYSVEERVAGKIFKHGSIVFGTHRVRGEHGDWFALLEEGEWLFETRESTQTLLPVDVERGIFCYRVDNGSGGLQLRSVPDYDPKFSSGEIFATGSIIYSDMRVRGEHGNWFPRIGSDGWLFEKCYGSRTLQRLDVEQGSFVYRVNNDPNGLVARRHPDSSLEQKSATEVNYKHGSIVVGTHRVRGEHGNWCVLVDDGKWLLEARDRHQYLILETNRPDSEEALSSNECSRKRRRVQTSQETKDQESVVIGYLESQIKELRQKQRVNGLQPRVPHGFLCAITQELMVEPVVASDGFTYERKAIEQWLRDHNTSPCTNLPLPDRKLVENRTLRSLIEDAFA